MTGLMQTRRIAALWASVCFVGAAIAYAGGDQETPEQLRRDAAATAQAQSAGTGRLKLDTIQGANSTPAKCPNPVTLDFFEHQIAYERTEELNPFRGVSVLHADVWQRGPLTAFYVREKLNDFASGVRMAYLFGKRGLQGGGTCPVDENWRDCAEGFANSEYAMDIVGICATTLEMGMIPVWNPSPNDQTKRRIAEELRNEIEAKWHGVQEIVIRDFNLEDNQITMYLKMPDGDYYEGCGFHAMSEPHCEGWHLSGTSPVSTSARRWIFALPYRLK